MQLETFGKQHMLHRYHHSFGQSDNVAAATKSQKSGFFWKKGLAEPSMSPCTGMMDSTKGKTKSTNRNAK